MGQQQLLLVILVTILVGIATVVALNVFGTAATDANRDAVRQDMLQAATGAQAIYARPVMLNGAGGNFENIAPEEGDEGDLLMRLGMPVIFEDDGETWGNENGIYSVTVVNEHQFLLLGEPATGPPNIQATVIVDDDGVWDVVWEDVDV